MKWTLVIILMSVASQWGFSQCNKSAVLMESDDGRYYLEELYAIRRGKVIKKYFHPIKGDSLYCILDSLPFMGSISKTYHQDDGSVYYTTWEIEDGVFVSMEQLGYAPWINPLTGQRDYPDSIWLRSVTHDPENRIEYFQNGTVAFKKKRVTSVDSLGTRKKCDSLIEYYKNGSLKYVKVQESILGIDSMYFDERKFFDSNEVMTIRMRSVDFYMDETHLSHNFRINQFEDTIVLENFRNKKREQRALQNCTIRLRSGKDSTIVIASQWENNRLLDIEERNIVFLNKRHRVITKAEFIEQLVTPYKEPFTKLRNYNNWFRPTYHDDFDWLYPIPIEDRIDNREELGFITQNWNVKRLNYSRLYRQVDRKIRK